MDKLSVMRAFCRIVERGSFAKAADDLSVSPALLSRDLKQLERDLGGQVPEEIAPDRQEPFVALPLRCRSKQAGPLAL